MRWPNWRPIRAVRWRPLPPTSASESDDQLAVFHVKRVQTGAVEKVGQRAFDSWKWAIIESEIEDA